METITTTTIQKTVINLRGFDDNLYFMIGNRRAAVGEETTITVSLKSAAEVGNEILCEKWCMVVSGILDQKPHSTMPGNTYQRLSVIILTKN